MAIRAIFEHPQSPGNFEWRESQNWFRRWLFWVTTRPRPALMLRAMCLLAFGAWLDILSGLQLSIFAFYFVPIFISSFMVSPRAGVFSSLLAAGTRAVANYFYPGHDGDWVILAWNFTVDSVSFLIFAFLLASVREQLDREITLARRDPLTRAFNRRAFIEQVEFEIGRLRRNGPPFTLVYLDLDNFKALNDARGHEAGDAMLCDVANTLQKELRTIDIVARLGGDEFAVLMPQTSSAGAETVLPRLQNTLRVAMESRACGVTFSIGSITFTSPPESFDAALREADTLMYRAKKNGKDRYFHETRSGQAHGLTFAPPGAGIRSEAPATEILSPLKRP